MRRRDIVAGRGRRDRGDRERRLGGALMQQTMKRFAVSGILTTAVLSVALATAATASNGTYKLRGMSNTVDGNKGPSETASCPDDASGFTDPWLLVSTGDDSIMAADRNDDGQICIERGMRRHTLVTVATDDSLGNPAIPSGPCTSPFVRMAIAKPARLLPWLREIDTHGDGILCGSGSLEASKILIVLLDNPNARPELNEAAT